MSAVVTELVRASVEGTLALVAFFTVKCLFDALDERSRRRP